jgi:hypothetical protein
MARLTTPRWCMPSMRMGGQTPRNDRQAPGGLLTHEARGSGEIKRKGESRGPDGKEERTKRRAE